MPLGCNAISLGRVNSTDLDPACDLIGQPTLFVSLSVGLDAYSSRIPVSFFLRPLDGPPLTAPLHDSFHMAVRILCIRMADIRLPLRMAVTRLCPCTAVGAVLDSHLFKTLISWI